MAEVDPVILELRAELGRYKAELRSTTTMVEQSLGRQEKSVKRLEAEMKRSSGAIGNTLKGLAATFAAAFTGRELIGLVDNFTRLQNALKVAGLEGERLAEVQDRLFQLGARYGVSVNALADLYGKAEQAGRELGASQAELLNLTTAVSQSILITGTSTEQASGAILGLTQALASGTVRAEEFNQINEGGLRPLLEAAAASDRFGGSIAKLRMEVVDGTVSSQEFYQAILDGSNLIEGKAANATLTLSGALQSLTDQLSRYFGEAGQGSGATDALASAIQALAQNLDTLIPILATVAVGLGIGFVTNAVRARIAAAALGTTAALTGKALLAAFGGPLGIALTAAAVGIAYVATQSDVASQATGQYKRVLDESKTAQDRAREAAERLASAHGKTRAEALAAAKAERENTKQKLAGARASLILAQAELKKARAFQAAQNQASFGSTGLPGTAMFIQGTGDTRVATARANVSANEQAISTLEGALADLSGVIAGGAPPKVSNVTSEKGGGSSSSRKGPTGPSAAEIAARQLDELARLRQEEIQAQIAITTDANERAGLQREFDAIEYDSRRRAIEADADLNKEQKAAQIEILDSLYGYQEATEDGRRIVVRSNDSLYAIAAERERLAQIEREEADLAAERYQSEQESLRLQYDLADTQDQRRAIALAILDAEDEYLRSKLEAVIASKIATEAEKERAQIALDAVNATAPARREAVSRSEAGALDRYVNSLSDPKERVEAAVVRQLERVNDGITDAISKAIGVEDPFIKDLLNILLEEVLLKPLAEALSGKAGGEGGLFQTIGTFIGSIFGGKARASGGYVSPGTMYRVNEGASPGRVEGFRPAGSGDIIPLGQMNALANSAMRGGGGGVTTVRLELSGDLDAKIDSRSANVAVEVTRASAPRLIDAAANETARRFSRPKL